MLADLNNSPKKERTFEKCKIANASSYLQHLNKYNVIFLNMQNFLSTTHNARRMIDELQTAVGAELAETYEALKVYIEMNFDGLKDSIIEMLAGNRVRINTATFQNDMTTFKSKDDVMTLLIHLGYLAYDFQTQEVFIPNYEVSLEFTNAIQNSDSSRAGSI